MAKKLAQEKEVKKVKASVERGSTEEDRWERTGRYTCQAGNLIVMRVNGYYLTLAE